MGGQAEITNQCNSSTGEGTLTIWIITRVFSPTYVVTVDKDESLSYKKVIVYSNLNVDVRIMMRVITVDNLLVCLIK